MTPRLVSVSAEDCRHDIRSGRHLLDGTVTS